MTLEPQPIGVPAPNPSRLSQPYWDACGRGELSFLRCEQCGTVAPLPTHRCGECLGEDLRWAPSSGRGTVYSWTVVWRPQHPAFVTPYAPAIVTTEEGWFHLGSIVGCEPEAIEAGLPVAVEFHPVSDTITLPYWRPA